jgi:hypothetical protein
MASAIATASVTTLWVDRLRDYLDDYVASQPALAAIQDDLDIVLHGSTTIGVDDPWSDLDLWGFVSPESLARADALSTTRFFEFELDGKKGHLNLETRVDALAWLDQCRMERIAELRRAVALTTGQFPADLIARARKPMSEEVRRAWACFHYVEMRGEHRACDTPIERGHSISLLLATTRTLEQALRCAMVIDGQPYPYCKWLALAAARTLTGAKVAQKVEEALDLLAQNALRTPGPEKHHPISLKLREIRAILVDSARASGIDEPWLTQWWLHMTQARDGISSPRWP